MIPRITFKGKKVGSYFSDEDKVEKEHQSVLTYGYYDVIEHQSVLNYGYYDVIKHGKSQTARYDGETNVRVGLREAEHANSNASAI